MKMARAMTIDHWISEIASSHPDKAAIIFDGETLSYKATLGRGYAVVRAEGEVITTKSQASGHTVLEIEFADGRLQTGTQGKASTKKPKQAPPDQGSLF